MKNHITENVDAVSNFDLFNNRTKKAFQVGIITDDITQSTNQSWSWKYALNRRPPL